MIPQLGSLPRQYTTSQVIASGGGLHDFDVQQLQVAEQGFASGGVVESNHRVNPFIGLGAGCFWSHPSAPITCWADCCPFRKVLELGWGRLAERSWVLDRAAPIGS
jgi:hypothetical protein